VISNERSQFEGIVAHEMVQRGAAAYELAAAGSNLVALVPEATDGPFIIKARINGKVDDLAWNHCSLAQIDTMEGVVAPSFRHQRPLGLHSKADLPYMIAEYIPGQTFEFPHELPAGSRYEYGREVAQYGLSLERAFTPENTESYFRKCEAANVPQSLYWPNWKETPDGLLWPLATFRRQDYPSLTDSMKEGLALRKLYYPNSLDNHINTIINDDLRIPNVVFDKQCRIKAIIDACFNRGNLDFYVRGLYPLGPLALSGFNDALDDSGHRTVSAELATFYGHTMVAAKVARLIIEAPQARILPKLIPLVIASQPGRDWSELSRISEEDSHSTPCL
jgi:hypothetical protein